MTTEQKLIERLKSYSDSNSNSPNIGKVLLRKKEIKEKVKELAGAISSDYQEKNPLLIGILKGAAVFLADLSRYIKTDLEIDYMAVSSFGASTKTSGIVRILKDLDEDIRGRHVLLIEDIIDSGLTLSYLTKNLKSRNPASLEICTLLKKGGQQKLPLKVKYQGFEIYDNLFVIGYGLDYHQKFRNLNQIYVLNNPPANNGY